MKNDLQCEKIRSMMGSDLHALFNRRILSFRRRPFLPAAKWVVLPLLLAGGIALADEVKVKGIKLPGTVVDVTSEGVVFQTDYGKGQITIGFADIQALSTEKPRVVLYGESEETVGRLIGLHDGKLLVGEQVLTAKRIDVTKILRAIPQEQANFLSEQLRNHFRFWSAELDLGLVVEETTIRETDVRIGGRVERRRRPTRLLVEGRYHLGRDQPRDAPTFKTENEVRGFLKGEYDATTRFFGFSSHELEHDEIDQLSLRWLSQAGPGYRLVDKAATSIQLETGLAYNHERFFGGQTNDSPGVAFGTEGKIELLWDTVLSFRGNYVPAIHDWVDDFLIIGEATLAVPINHYLAFKWSVFDTYDATPDVASERNELKTILSLAWRF